MNTSTIHALILVPVFFALMKERALRRNAGSRVRIFLVVIVLVPT